MAVENDQLDLAQYIPVETDTSDIKQGIFGLVDTFLQDERLNDDQRLKIARLRAYIDINFTNF